jgi:hypothetical protein
MATLNENRDFAFEVIGDNFLDSAIEWTQNNLRPEDVFKDSQMEEWYLNNGFVEDVDTIR